jgi:DNA-binding NarL/FixJ family response regulator
MSEPLRVVVADDHPVYRSGLRMSLVSLGGFDVVREAAAGEEAILAARELRPDVVLMDINMPGVNGIDATRRVVEENPDVRVLILTMFEDDDSVFAAMRAGALGYLVKGADEEAIVRAVRSVAAGEAVFGSAVAARILRYFANAGPGVGTGASTAGASPEAPFPQLSAREREILALIAAGHPNPVIADRLFLSPKTVRNHVSNIFTKLHVADRSEAIVRAREAGIGRERDRPGAGTGPGGRPSAP